MKLVGLITRTDILHAAAGTGPDGKPIARLTTETPASAVMNKNVVTAQVDAPLVTAVKVMLHEKLGCLPVIREDKVLVGIITDTDFARLAPRVPRALLTDAPRPPTHGIRRDQTGRRHRRQVPRPRHPEPIARLPGRGLPHRVRPARRHPRAVAGGRRREGGRALPPRGPHPGEARVGARRAHHRRRQDATTAPSSSPASTSRGRTSAATLKQRGALPVPGGGALHPPGLGGGRRVPREQHPAARADALAPVPHAARRRLAADQAHRLRHREAHARRLRAHGGRRAHGDLDVRSVVLLVARARAQGAARRPAHRRLVARRHPLPAPHDAPPVRGRDGLAHARHHARRPGAGHALPARRARRDRSDHRLVPREGRRRPLRQRARLRARAEGLRVAGGAGDHPAHRRDRRRRRASAPSPSASRVPAYLAAADMPLDDDGAHTAFIGADMPVASPAFNANVARPAGAPAPEPEGSPLERTLFMGGAGDYVAPSPASPAAKQRPSQPAPALFAPPIPAPLRPAATLPLDPGCLRPAASPPPGRVEARGHAAARPGLRRRLPRPPPASPSWCRRRPRSASSRPRTPRRTCRATGQTTLVRTPGLGTVVRLGKAPPRGQKVALLAVAGAVVLLSIVAVLVVLRGRSTPDATAEATSASASAPRAPPERATASAARRPGRARPRRPHGDRDRRGERGARGGRAAGRATPRRSPAGSPRLRGPSRSPSPRRPPATRTRAPSSRSRSAGRARSPSTARPRAPRRRSS